MYEIIENAIKSFGLFLSGILPDLANLYIKDYNLLNLDVTYG